MTTTRRTLAQHADAIEAAPATYRQAIASLTKNGTRIYADEEHEARVRAAWNAWQATLKDASDAASEASAAAMVEIEGIAGTLVGSTQLERLTSTEATRAQAIDSFIKEDFDHLPLEALAARVKAVAATGDQVSRLLYHRHARRVLAGRESERSGPLEVRDGRPVPPGSTMTDDERRLLAATDALAAALTAPADASRRASAEARLTQANDLGAMIVMAQHDFSTYTPRPGAATRTR